MRIVVGEVNLPTMVRVGRIAELLATTPYWVVKFCKANGVPIATAGAQKIKMISRDKFFEKFEQEKTYESIQKN